MTKSIDWNSIATVNFDEQRRKKLGIKTGKEAFAKAYENLAKAEEMLARRKEVEPLLKNFLLDHMLNRKPIRVLQAIRNPTEVVSGGLNKSQTDDDDGFYNTSPSMSQEASANVSFVEAMETIPAGIDLIFKGLDKQMGQWLFKGSNGKEYAIYDKPMVLFQKQAIENPGFYGLLFQTNLVNLLD